MLQTEQKGDGLTAAVFGSVELTDGVKVDVAKYFNEDRMSR